MFLSVLCFEYGARSQIFFANHVFFKTDKLNYASGSSCSKVDYDIVAPITQTKKIPFYLRSPDIFLYFFCFLVLVFPEKPLLRKTFEGIFYALKPFIFILT